MTTLRYFSLGRHAMRVALIHADVKHGDKVMIPGFICRDLLAAINSLGALPIFYDVDEELKPLHLDISVMPKVIIAVNYFGFEQDLEPFKRFSDHTRALIIEDNAHGFLSRDINNNLLGQRTKFGITSFRKTLKVVDGATLATTLDENSISEQVEFSGQSIEIRSKLLRVFSSIERKTKLPIVGVAQTASRLIRFILTGSKFQTSHPEVENQIPGLPNPHATSIERMSSIDQCSEINRRRNLFIKILPEVQKLKLRPIFTDLPNGVCPYGLPLYAPVDSKKLLTKLARRHRVTLMTWPELPQEILPTAPDHYKQVWLLNFR
jgi:DegT/DnrJ/EryC1/StrS aminotransferase family